MAEVGEFLDADSFITQGLDGGPGPECTVFLAVQVAAFAGVGVLGPGSRTATGGSSSSQAPACDREREPGVLICAVCRQAAVVVRARR
jgi:hypothetical protein